MATSTTPGAVKTSVGYETPQETLARSQAMLSSAQSGTSTPTPAQTYKTLPTYAPTDNYDTALTSMANSSKDTASQAINPTAIYRDKLKQYQAEIDAVNQLYSQKINQAKIDGQGRLGTARATQGRSGLLGSDFAAAQNDNVTTDNNAIVSGIQGEQAAKVQSLLGQARKDATDEAAAKTLAKQQGAEAYLKYLGEQSTRRAAKLDNLVASVGTTDLSTIDPTNLADVAKSYGVSVDELTQKIKTAQATAAAATAKTDMEQKKTQAEIDKINADIASGKLQTLGEGNKLIDTTTGQVIAFNPKTYAPKEVQPTYGGYTEDQSKKISSIDDKVSKNDTYKKTSNMRAFVDNVNASLSLESGTGDLAAINQFQKVIDEGAVTRDQDVTLIKNSQSLLNRLSTFADGLKNGDQLSPDLRSEMKSAVNSLYAAQVKAMQKDPFITAKKTEASRYGINPSDTILGELGAFDAASGSNSSPIPPDVMAKIKADHPDLTEQDIIDQFNSQQ